MTAFRAPANPVRSNLPPKLTPRTLLPPFIDVTDPAGPPPGLAKAVVAIGNFDGLHRGHRAVLSRAKALALRLGRTCALLTFEPHPADVFAGEPVIFRLTPHDAKAAHLAELGLEGMIVLTFDRALAALDAEAFVRDILVGRLDIAGAVVGYDFHFGAKRVGSPAFLREAGAQTASRSISSSASWRTLTARSTRCPPHRRARRWNVATSKPRRGSSAIHGLSRERSCMAARSAATSASRPPTSRLIPRAACDTASMPYACAIDGVTRDGVASFGTRPVFDDGPPLLEVHLLDFAGDLYDKAVEVAFVGLHSR